MRLSRFLIAGVLVPVVLGTNDSTAEVCSGRFYVGVNVGAEFGKMKYSSKPGDQYNVVPDGISATEDIPSPGDTGIWGNEEVLHELHILPLDRVHAKLQVQQKRKIGFTGDVEIGYLNEIKNFGFGLAVHFGKDFANKHQVIKSRLVQYTPDSEAATDKGEKGIVWRTDAEANFIEEQYRNVINRRLVVGNDNYNSMVKYNTKDVTEIKLTNKFNVTITPIIEYKANPMFGVFITGGIRISNDKVTYKETDGATKKVTNFKKTKTSIAPVVGGGVMINLSDHMYAKVQYLYQFGSKIKKTISRKINDKKNEVTPTVKYRSQKVTVGFGYMF